MTVSLQKTPAFQDISGHFLCSRKSPKHEYRLCMTVSLLETPAFQDISSAQGNLIGNLRFLLKFPAQKLHTKFPNSFPSWKWLGIILCFLVTAVVNIIHKHDKQKEA